MSREFFVVVVSFTTHVSSDVILIRHNTLSHFDSLVNTTEKRTSAIELTPFCDVHMTCYTTQ